ncbi:MAG: carboxylating nicotinate-nucleotide diphosphorylase [Desulfovibrio sp.]|jgi:nicotinate-nucleotide pyrophosphorylase (carboxylating)|nr:carboxylating nicotinate-nucleotide diphosphorylase [Desulfovibrio sp.]
MFTPWADFFSPAEQKLLDRSIDLALDEDGRDMTAEAVFSPSVILEARIRAKQESLVVGLPIIGAVLKRLGAFAWRPLAREGAKAPAMTDVAVIAAPATILLRAERVILNYICRLSGIANLTARYVRELEGTGVRLLDTRKTAPGLRLPEKYAVQVGGGSNHRRNLSEMLMLKDNHIDAAGSIARAVALLRERCRPCPPIEVECRTLEHVREAVAANVERIMMDNMTPELLVQALGLVRSAPHRIETEASGGVSLENIRRLALLEPKPDFISVGRLTHSAPAADFSMSLNNRPERRLSGQLYEQIAEEH